MLTFYINNQKIEYQGDINKTLLSYLRDDLQITSAKDGCSGQGTCGACMVNINGKAKLACLSKLSKLQDARILTLEGLEKNKAETIAGALVEKGAVQCGFCTPGIIMSTEVLLTNKAQPSKQEIEKALKPHLCRCTGYVKIIEGIEYASTLIKQNKAPNLDFEQKGIGQSLPKYKGLETALGKRHFVNDMHIAGMLHAALRYSDHPRAKIIAINKFEAEKVPGVIRIFTAKDVPGNLKTGLIYPDWPLMIPCGSTSNYIGDVIAGVVAETEEIARKAAKLIQVEYEILEPVTDMHRAIKTDAIRVHADRDNLLAKTRIKIGKSFTEFKKEAAFSASGIFETQRIEHAFLETETAIANPAGKGVHIFSGGQGVYVERSLIASMLGLAENLVQITLVPSGGGFGGKEDLTVQGHVALFAFLLQKPVKLHLSREDSLRMHPKRHPVYMDMQLTATKEGKLSGIKLYAVGDTGAYASVGDKVLERVAGHATGGYYVPNVDIEALTVYTNNIPCGAMRGFGANQVAFALESLVDELCEKGGFDRWKFRYDNALREGLSTSTGQVLEKGVGIQASLLAVKEEFYANRYTGLACAIKNSGVGNGMIDESKTIIKIVAENKIIIHHGWTEMGQGIHNMAIQTLCQETGLNADIMDVVVDTTLEIPTGMTTSSRATALLGNAIIDAAKNLNKDLKSKTLSELIGNIYFGEYSVDWTTKPGSKTKKQITHYSYGYAAQLVILDEKGKITKVVAAHDAGKIMNPTLFTGQIEGAVHMGLGYALSEDFPMENGYPKSLKLKDVGVLRAHKVPEIIVKGVEVTDPVGPYGAKGVGEIGLVPTAAAVANAFYQFDKIRRYKLPLQKISTKK
ncbi:MAG: selenium-dependent xanthine dehydrogenase [Bacteroidales bacterium]|nr:selenium-dependent xanthine dehydrogenase [Bacteroidales bacterium]